MNRYTIITRTISFDVVTDGADQARAEATSDIFEFGHPVPSQRAILMQGNVSLGEFDLKGMDIPSNWAGIKQLKSDLFIQAKSIAKKNSEMPVVRSRGALLTVTDATGKVLISTADVFYIPETLTKFKESLKAIKEEHPSAVHVMLSVGCDSADSVHDMNNDCYEPWTGEAYGLVHEYTE